MSRSIRRKPALRKPLAIASALALSAGVALAFTPTAGASGGLTCEDSNIPKLAKATGGLISVTEIGDTCYVLHYFDEGHIGDSTFTITSKNPVDVDYLIAGGGGGGGGGSGWADGTKAGGTQPDSGAGAGGAGGEVKTGTASALVAGDFTVSVGAGGIAGAKGTSTAGSTVGSQGGNGGLSSFNSIVASGGAGGFGGTGIEGVASVSFSPVSQTGVSGDPRAAGQYGGNNGSYVGGNLDKSQSYVLFAAPGGAGAGGNGGDPIMADGGAGGPGVTSNIRGFDVAYGGGGGGGTLDPGSFPYQQRLGGTAVAGGGAGNSTGNGGNATAYRGGGGGGGNTDGSVTPGDSNAGFGGIGGAGQVILRYVALTAPLAPAAPTVVAGDGHVTATITPLAETPDSYTVFVVGDPSKSCEITPPETSCVIACLTNDTDYTFEAVAGNAVGDSVASDPSAIATPQAPATTTTTTAPSGSLPYTGSDSRGLASMAVVMIAIGGAVTLVARRRRSTIG